MVANAFSLPAASVLQVLGLLLAAITAGTVVRRLALAGAEEHVARQRMASLRTWWVLVVLVSVATLLGRGGATLLFGIASALAVGEFLHLARLRSVDGPAIQGVFFLLLFQYGVIFAHAETRLALVVPLGGLAYLGSRLVIVGETDGFLRSVGSLFWGAMLLVYGLSHAPALFLLPEEVNPTAGGAGWFLYLVILSQVNDIAQALTGRRFGRRKITPRVSPHKTWEGLVGGIVVTTALAMLIAPLLTPWDSLGASAAATASTQPYTNAPPWLWATLAGLLISLAGFFGDVNLSAIKRDAHVKDSGTLLPGQGGVIDRIDGLTLSAPLFYYYVAWCTGAGP